MNLVTLCLFARVVCERGIGGDPICICVHDNKAKSMWQSAAGRCKIRRSGSN